MDENEWHYDLIEDKGIIRSGTKVDSKLKHLDLVIDLRDDRFFVYYICPLNVEKSERAQMRDLMNRINYGIMFGNLEMDDEDGEVRFRLAVDCEDCLPSHGVIENAFLRPALTMRKYGNAIVEVLMGVSTGEEAYEKVNQN
jgi:hypothetical protein